MEGTTHKFSTLFGRGPAEAQRFDDDMAALITQAVDASGLIEHEVAEQVEEAFDSDDMDEKIEKAVDKHLDDWDFSKDIEAVLGGYDFGSDIDTALNDYDFAEAVEEVLTENGVCLVGNIQKHVHQYVRSLDFRKLFAEDIKAAVAAQAGPKPTTFFGRLRWLLTGRV